MNIAGNINKTIYIIQYTGEGNILDMMSNIFYIYIIYIQGCPKDLISREKSLENYTFLMKKAHHKCIVKFCFP